MVIPPPPYKLIPLSISGKLTLPQKILEVSSDSPLLFRREKDAMQVQYTIQVATDFDQYFLTVNILLLLVVIGQLI